MYGLTEVIAASSGRRLGSQKECQTRTSRLRCHAVTGRCVASSRRATELPERLGELKGRVALDAVTGVGEVLDARMGAQA